jgi:DNA-binding transcriptional regulator YdaS (Cro superfamily)
MDKLNTGTSADADKVKGQKPRAGFLKTDFPLVRSAVFTFGASLLFLAVLVGVSSMLVARWRAIGAERSAERSKAQARLAEARIELRELRENLPQFEQMRQSGLIGDERRLDLMEQLKGIQQARRLMTLSYTMAPQKAFAVDPVQPTGNMQVRGSRITLKLPLLHELDLLHLLADLKGRGMYVPEECSVKRIDWQSGEPLGPRLQAECALYWVTLAQAKVGEPAPPPL